MFDREFAARIKEEYPEIWAKGGNIKGNAQYSILTKIADAGGTATTPDQINALELREAWVARHADDFRLPGVIAQIKWLAVGSRGEDHMKNVVREAMEKVDERKKKSADNDLDEAFADLDEKQYSGMVANLTYELARRFGGPAKIREIRGGRVVFDHMHDDKPMTMRVTFRYSDGEFMFGEPEEVRVRTFYTVVEDGDEEGEYGEEEQATDDYKKPEEEKDCGCGCGGKGGCGAGRRFDVLSRLREMMKSDAFGQEIKAGRVISASNLEKLQRAMDILQEVIAAGGQAEIELKDGPLGIAAETEELFGLKSFIDPVLDYYGADTEVVEDGIIIKSISGNFSMFDEALSNALVSYKSVMKSK